MNILSGGQWTDKLECPVENYPTCQAATFNQNNQFEALRPQNLVFIPLCEASEANRVKN